jgi:monovalent cation:H+ antiporter, CPA1 family
MSVLTLALLFMILAAVVAIIAERVRLPYTIALVLAGIVAGSLHVFPPLAVSSEVLLTLLIPPLLFEGSLFLSPADLRTYGWLIALLAIPGTLIAALAIGGVAGALFHLPARTALLLGAVASAIDPVSVIALIRETRLDTRLGAILEAEAVWNDGVAIVLFTIVAGPARVGVLAATGQFVWLVGLGSLVGAVLAFAVSSGLARTTQPRVEALGSLILAVGSLVAASSLGASGVIAVVVAGLVFGSVGMRDLTEAGRAAVRTLWDVIAFLANAMLFLLIGLEVPGALLLRYGSLIAAVIAASLAVRALVVYGVCAMLGRAVPLARGWRAVLTWGGLRGGVAVALVLGLPGEMPGRQAVGAAVFGLVVFTLLGQGLSIRAVMRRSGLLGDRSAPRTQSP